MPRWEKREFSLPATHRWQARKGNKIFVADRGAVQFEYPGDWVPSPGEHSFCFYDKPEPDDDIRLECSMIRMPPIKDDDWSGLPLSDLLENTVLTSDERGVTRTGRNRRLRRPNLEAEWLEVDFFDSSQDRWAKSRMCLARGNGIQAFITMDYWPEDAPTVRKVWDDVLRSLKLGEYISNPFRGPQRKGQA